MSEPRDELVVQAVVARLAAIVGDLGATYWYTPTVRRVIEPTEADLDASLPAIYFLAPGDQADEEAGSGGVAAARAELFLTLCVRLPGEGHKDEQQTRWVTANRAVGDVKRALLADVTLGGLVDNVFFGSVRIDRSFFVERWAWAEMRFTLAYDYTRAAP
jgi:hypothetical protein